MALLSGSLMSQSVSANCLNSNIMNANVVASEITYTRGWVQSSLREANRKSVEAFNAYMTSLNLI